MSRPQSAKAATEKTVNGPRGSDLGRIGPQATTADNSEQPKSWRDVLPVHPAAELFPLMSAAELRELADDIKTNGLREPVNPVGKDGKARLARKAAAQPASSESSTPATLELTPEAAPVEGKVEPTVEEAEVEVLQEAENADLPLGFGRDA